MSLTLPLRPPGATAQIVVPRLGLVLAAGVLALYGLIAVFVASHIHHRLDPAGSPLFYDFSAFHQAAQFADHGRAAAAYDDKAMIGAEQAAFPGTTARLPWNYPPSFLLMLMPFGAMPYMMAWLAWSLTTFGAYALMAQRLAAPGQRYLALLAPGAAINILVGQNGLVSAAILGGGAMLLERRPILGGLILGLISYKPHFALLVPLALIATRQWRALAGAAASSLVLALAAAVVLGAAPWIAFLHKAAQPASLIASSSSAWRTIPSVMVMARTLGVDAGLSSLLHWSAAALAAGACLWIWRKTGDGRLRAGALAAATLMITPYLRVYDLALLTLPIAALWTGDGEVSLGERTILMAAWLLPAGLLLAAPTIQPGPLAPAALLWLLARRAKAIPANASAS
jgi:hypothetical protein